MAVAESSKAETLLSELERQISGYINESPRLQKLVRWLDKATCQQQNEYKFFARRAAALYFVLDLVTLLYQAQTFGISDCYDPLIGLAGDLAHLVDENFVQDDMWCITAQLGNAVDYKRLRYVRDYMMYNNVKRHNIGLSEVKEHLEVGLSMINFEDSDRWILNNSLHHKLFSAFKDLLPIINNLEDNFEKHLWFGELVRQTLLHCLEIDEKWITELSEQEQNLLDNYLRTNKLMMECIKMARQDFPSACQNAEDNLLIFKIE